MKGLNYFFWAVVACVGITFGMSVYTAVAEHREEKKIEEATGAIPLPAEPAKQ